MNIFGISPPLVEHATSRRLSRRKVGWKRRCGETVQKWLRVLNDFTIGMVRLGRVHAVSVTSAARRKWHSAESVSACELSSVQHRTGPRLWLLSESSYPEMDYTCQEGKSCRALPFLIACCSMTFEIESSYVLNTTCPQWLFAILFSHQWVDTILFPSFSWL